MTSRKISSEEIKEQKEQQKIRNKLSRAARRSGNITKKEGKVNEAKAKTTTPRSQKKMVAIKKSRY